VTVERRARRASSPVSPSPGPSASSRCYASLDSSDDPLRTSTILPVTLPFPSNSCACLASASGNRLRRLPHRAGSCTWAFILPASVRNTRRSDRRAPADGEAPARTLPGGSGRSSRTDTHFARAKAVRLEARVTGPSCVALVPHGCGLNHSRSRLRRACVRAATERGPVMEEAFRQAWDNLFRQRLEKVREEALALVIPRFFLSHFASATRLSL
jgi:hypothetical protein